RRQTCWQGWPARARARQCACRGGLLQSGAGRSPGSCALRSRSRAWPWPCASASRSRPRLAFGRDSMAPRAENAQASAPSARKREALELFAGLPRRYDLLSAALSFGQDPRWRRALVDALAPEPGDRVLDVATGTGLVARELLE